MRRSMLIWRIFLILMSAYFVMILFANLTLNNVYGATLSVSISPSSVTMDVDQSQLFTSTVSGGTPPYTYQWYLNSALVPGATNPTWTYTPTSAGSRTVFLKVTDAVSTVATSNTASVTVNRRPIVTITVGSATMDVGQSLFINSAVVYGTSPFSYQWYLNNAPVSGATSSSWTFTPTSSGSYTVYVNATDNVGVTAKSNIATITVNPTPTITIAPTSVTLELSQSQTFTSTASGGTPPYTYQWYLNGAPVSGATSSSWTFTPTSTGSYTVYVNMTDNVLYKVKSNIATVSVISPSVSISPASATLDLGQSQTFTSTVSSGTPPYTYQWYLNGAPVSGATSSSWTFTPTSTGSYTVYVNATDHIGVTAKSNVATITVNPTPTVTIAPTSVIMDVTQSQLFTSSVSAGTPPYSYQWYLNGAAVPGATGATWAFTPSSQGSYTVYVNMTDSVNFRVKSNVASVTVNPAPSVSISPAFVTMDVGQSQLFTSTVSGGMSPYSYQWYLNSAPVSGATNPSWTFTPTSIGNYQVYLIVTDNVHGQATSNIASVTVNPLPSVTISPTSLAIDLGQSKTFTSTVSGGTSPFIYQWYLDDAPVSDATNPTWTFAPSSTGIYRIYLIITDNVGKSAQSNIATLTVNPPLSVSVSPSSIVMDVGQSQTFTAIVSGGTSPYAYQWYVNTTLIPGATGTTWAFTPTFPGTYSIYVTVTDNANVTQSPPVQPTTVNPALAVSIAPTSVIMDAFQPQTFTSTVSGGTSPFSYQWYLDNAPVSGATYPSWTFTPDSSGSYAVYLQVNDSVHVSIDSPSSSVTVNPQPTVTVAPSIVTIYLGQSQSFISNLLGGTSPYTYQWYLDDNPFPNAISNFWIFTPTATGTHQIYLKVTDAVNVVAQSNTAQLTVDPPPPVFVTISPSFGELDLGQSVMFTSSVTSGSPPFSYQWYLDGALVSGATDPTWTFTPISTGSYLVYVVTTDSLYTQGTSNTAPVTVNSVPSVSIIPTSALMDVGQSKTFASTVSGGTPPYTYQWYLNNAAVPGATSQSWTFTPSSSGFYSIYVNVTDKVSFWVKSNVATTTVNPALNVPISPDSATIYVGQFQLFTSDVSGGTPPYSYQWYLNDTLVYGANGPTWIFTPIFPGPLTVYLQVTDAIGMQISSNRASLMIYLTNIAVTELVPSKSLVYSGEVLDIRVDVENMGNTPQTFNVTLYYGSDNIALETEQVSLAPFEGKSMIFQWNTSAIVYKISYSLMAKADILLHETCITDNLLINGTVQIRLMGDGNGDGIVNIGDASLLGIAWLSKTGDANYNPDVDFNHDGILNILDATDIGFNWLTIAEPTFKTSNTVFWNGHNYLVASTSNATVSNVSYNGTLKQLTFNLSGPKGLGAYCEMTIPNELMSGPFTVLVDGSPVPFFILNPNAKNFTIRFTCTLSTHQVSISGYVPKNDAFVEVLESYQKEVPFADVLKKKMPWWRDVSFKGYKESKPRSS